MERGLYTAAAGMSIADQWISTISCNLANASTTAYKKDMLVFNEAFERQLSSDDGTKIGGLGAGPASWDLITVWEHGAINPTGSPFDLAIGSNEGLMKVRTPKGDFYTRNGSLALNMNGELVTSMGGVILGKNGSPIKVPPGQMVIANDGTVSVKGKDLGQIAIFKGTFAKAGDGRYTSEDATEMEGFEAKIQQGFLEGSNVNVVEEMIAMIKLNRAFELAQKSAQSHDDSTERLIGILGR